MRCVAAIVLSLYAAVPLFAQDQCIGSWVGDSPGARSLKLELTIAKDGAAFSVVGRIFKEGQEVGSFKGTNVKVAKGAIEFSEAVEKAPAEWNDKAKKSSIKGSPEAIQYERFVGTKRSFAFLRPKTAESFDRVVLGKKEAQPKTDPVPANKNTNSGEPLPSADPNKMLYAVGPLLDMLFTADGKTMVSAAGDSVIRFWDLETKKQTASIVADKGLASIAITPDGKLIAGGVGNTPVLWDASGKEIARFGEHGYFVSGVALTPDGKTLISTDDGSTTAGQPDGNTKFWDIATQKEIAGVPFCGKGTLAISASANKVVFLNGRYVKTPSQPLAPFINFYKVLNLQGKALYELPTNHQIVRDSDVSPDGKLLLTACLKGNINLLNLATGKIQKSLKNRPFEYINAVAFSPDGKQFAVGGSGGQAVLYQTATGKELTTLKASPGEMQRLAFTPDGRHLLAAGSNENAIVATPLKE